MSLLDLKLADWTRSRRRLELETRLLVVEDEPAVRRQLDDLLYRLRVPSRSVVGSEQAIELLGSGSYPLLLVSENLAGLGGLYLIRQVRRAHPAVDALVSSWEPSLELLGRAFDLRLLDVVRKPLPERQILSEVIRAAIHRNVDRRMRRFLVQELHASLDELPEEVRTPTTRQLEYRLNEFKSTLGAFDRVLVVESDDAELRLLSESLLLAGLHVETALSLESALARAKDGAIHLIALQSNGAEPDLRALMAKLRAANPLLEALVVSSQPEVELARAALLLDAAGYLPWPPPSRQGLVSRVQAMLKRSRRERLLDNLVVELFRETNRALGGTPAPECFPRFCQLVGMDRVGPEAAAPPPHTLTGDDVEYLGDVLDNLLAPEEPAPINEGDEPKSDTSGEAGGAERRKNPRVPESQFIRFRTKAAPASCLGLLGDLSEGGLFIRTDELRTPGTFLELEFQASHQGQGYLVCVRAQVAWVARDNRQSPLGPGFGVRFISAPPDVVALLKEIIKTRISEPS